MNENFVIAKSFEFEMICVIFYKYRSIPRLTSYVLPLGMPLFSLRIHRLNVIDKADPDTLI